jgi:NAD-dependent dihydropyrimidine dehydrogenase PreA subunit
VRLDGELRFQGMTDGGLQFEGPALPSWQYATGDYFITIGSNQGLPPARITAIGSGGLTLSDNQPAKAAGTGDRITLLVRMQLPFVDPALCIGCGVCEHECPVKGRRAIRVTAENESRERRHRLLL